MHRSAEKGVITIAFDDAYLDTYRHAIKHLNRLKIKSTVAVVSSLVGKTLEKRRVVGLKELKAIVKSGHEIASHTLTHANLLRLRRKDENATVAEIAESKKQIKRLLNCKVSSFVFPYINKIRSRALCLKTKPFYESARITANDPCFNKIPPGDTYAITGFAVMKKHSLSCLKKQIDYAAKNKLWLIEVFHLVSDKNTLSAHRPKPYRFFMHIDDFKKHVSYIRSKDIRILTQKDVIKPA